MVFLKQLIDSLEADKLFNKKLNVFVFVILALIVGGLSSSNTSDDLWYQGLVKSDLNPPGYVFGIVWPILYLLMSISAYRNFDSIAKIFFIQLFFNTIWYYLVMAVLFLSFTLYCFIRYLVIDFLEYKYTNSSR